MASVVMATSTDDELIIDKLKIMYKIIMNDKDDDCMIATEGRAIIDILKDCLSLMVEKFGMMSDRIDESKKENSLDDKEKENLYKDQIIEMFDGLCKGLGKNA